MYLRHILLFYFKSLTNDFCIKFLRCGFFHIIRLTVLSYLIFKNKDCSFIFIFNIKIINLPTYFMKSNIAWDYCHSIILPTSHNSAIEVYLLWKLKINRDVLNNLQCVKVIVINIFYVWQLEFITRVFSTF